MFQSDPEESNLTASFPHFPSIHGSQAGLYHLSEKLISITEINLEKFCRVQEMWPWIYLSMMYQNFSLLCGCVQHNQPQYLQIEPLMEKSNRNVLSSVSWLRISDVGAAWHSRDGGSCRAAWSAAFWMLLLEDEKYRSARDWIWRRRHGVCLDLSQGRSQYKQAALCPDGCPEQEATAQNCNCVFSCCQVGATTDLWPKHPDLKLLPWPSSIPRWTGECMKN